MVWPSPPRSLTQEIHDEYRNEQEYTCEACEALIAPDKVGCITEEMGSETVAGYQWPLPVQVAFCQGCHEDYRCDCD
ncbi:MULTISPECIES: hypothetical protein [unclassified Streptomyces]|uniref:hypothetical protein n=1 Tax=unclassified Streptomyces TaxID=2593676 RepID=UPI0004CB2DA8|nr:MULTISPECIES: hypothetical protein [unclassified Streptomyces]KOV89171.1 hypothetical protein ADL02_16020 [Streptomyces sp. NRRL WC-3723]